MKKKPQAVAKTRGAPFYARIREILESARASVARSVNTTQVVANWLIGREIVEEEQRGRKRAGYGEQLLRDLSVRLRSDFGRGYSVDNLEMFRRFYLEYGDLISDAVRRILPEMGISDALRTKFTSPRSVNALRTASAAASRSGKSAIRHAVRDLSTDNESEFSEIDHSLRSLLGGPFGINREPPEIQHALRGELKRSNDPEPSVEVVWRPGQLHPNLSWTHRHDVTELCRSSAVRRGDERLP